MEKARFDKSQALAVFVIGACIGWLSGLSVSPVISTVLSTLVGVGSSFAVGARITRGQPGAGLSIDGRPAALMMLGVALVAPAGIIVRTHDLFGVSGQLPIEVGVPPAEPQKRTVGGLFAAPSDRCAELMAQAEFPNPKALPDAIRALGPDGTSLVDRVRDVSDLRLAVRAICLRE